MAAVLPDYATDSLANSDTTPRALPLAFHGNAREYFRVWAVNLCLTLLTLGVFSAWAKVRKKRYFYSHTVLDGTPFQYLAQPLPILKGRLVAAALFLVYYLSSHYFTAILPYVLAAGLVLAPWVIIRSAAFNARYSAYRNISFVYQASYRDAVKALYVWGLIPAIVVGTMFGWWGQPALAAIAFGLFGLAFPWWLRRLKHLIIRHTEFGGQAGEFSGTGRQFFRVYFTAGLIVFATAAATGGLIAAVTFGGGKNSPYLLLGSLLPIYFGYVLAFAFIQARISNLVWNQTRLGPLQFQSTLRGRELAKLYVTNALAIAVSLGLLIPWAVIRTLKYRIDRLQIQAQGPLDDFRGDERSAVQAAGSEVSEFFDMDLSI